MKKRVEFIVEHTKKIDMHTHLFPIDFEKLFLMGIDELLTYHYLVAELLSSTENISPNSYFKYPKIKQANIIWEKLFTNRTPLSEAQKSILDILFVLDIPYSNSLDTIRQRFNKLMTNKQEYLEKILSFSNISQVVMTNDPVDEVEMYYWNKIKLSGLSDYFRPAIRLDNALIKNELTNEKLQFWVDSFNPDYFSISINPNFDFDNICITDILLPFLERNHIPLAIMAGVKREVNPYHILSGDGLGKFEVNKIEKLLRDFPNNRFLLTMLSKENQHEIAVLSRKFNNLMVFGCWWFNNIPVLIREITSMRLELLGSQFIPQHSDARVLEHLISKWKLSDKILIELLIERYKDLEKIGFHITDEYIKKDINKFYNTNYLNFINY